MPTYQKLPWNLTAIFFAAFFLLYNREKRDWSNKNCLWNKIHEGKIIFWLYFQKFANESSLIVSFALKSFSFVWHANKGKSNIHSARKEVVASFSIMSHWECILQKIELLFIGEKKMS